MVNLNLLKNTLLLFGFFMAINLQMLYAQDSSPQGEHVKIVCSEENSGSGPRK